MSEKNIAAKVKRFPQRPGIYRFKNAAGVIIYVGKALSLKDRVRSYLGTNRTSKTDRLMHEAVDVDYIETGSEFEALLLEAKLIKKEQPRYNVALRDDKSYLYIFISTKETYPKIFTTRKPKAENKQTNNTFEGMRGEYFGPFTSAGDVRLVLADLRRIFPFCQQKTIGKRACFYSHIGLCRPCPSAIEKMDGSEKKAQQKVYRRNVLTIRRILLGKLPSVTQQIEKEMQSASHREAFEEAALLRNQWRRLIRLTKPRQLTKAFLENPNFYYERQQKALVELKQLLDTYQQPSTSLKRIECFDISNFQGKFAAGSQIVFVDGIPEKGLYRRYKIRNDGKPNDVESMAQMITRRLRHPDWPRPDVIIVDGGKPQVGRIRSLLHTLRIELPLFGLAKREEILVFPTVLGGFAEVKLERNTAILQLVQQLRDESHRFALKYHRTLRKKAFDQAAHS